MSTHSLDEHRFHGARRPEAWISAPTGGSTVDQRLHMLRPRLDSALRGGVRSLWWTDGRGLRDKSQPTEVSRFQHERLHRPSRTTASEIIGSFQRIVRDALRSWPKQGIAGLCVPRINRRSPIKSRDQVVSGRSPDGVPKTVSRSAEIVSGRSPRSPTAMPLEFLAVYCLGGGL